MDCTLSPVMRWIAIALSCWLNASLQSESVAAFSNTVSGLCSFFPPHSRYESTSLLKRHLAAAHHHNQYGTSSLLYMSTKDQQDLRGKFVDGEPAEPSPTTDDQLQKRFEEAMQRRRERRSQYVASSSPTGDPLEDALSRMGESTIVPPNEIEVETSASIDVTENDREIEICEETSSEAKEIVNEDIQPNNIHDGYESNDPVLDLEREGSESKKSRRPRQPKLVNDDAKNTQTRAERPQRTNRPPKERIRRDKVNDGKFGNRRDREYYDEDQYTWDNHYVDYNYEMDYDDYDRGYSSRSTPTSEWETYRSTSILFPPLTQATNNGTPTRPKAIIHFVGGTFFGSYPRKFYGTLLEDIACKCDAVVVATPIPLVLPGKGLVNKLENWMFDEGGSDDDWNRRQGRRAKNTSRESTNPLDHLSLAETIQKEFNNAYRDVILDEYCSDFVSDEEVEDFMKGVPIVGIGHSLGARIQVISCSHPRISNRYLSMGKGNQLIRSGRDGMIYLGFANWGASSSIPGVAELDRTVKRRKQGRQEQDRRRAVGRRDDVWDERSRRKRRPRYDSDVGRRYSRYDRYDAEDLDLVDVFSDVVTSVAKGAKQIGEALTPESKDLEFAPTPNELWDDLSSLEGWYSQSCQNNLIVQFDQDPIDQGSRLARTLLTAYDEELNSTTSVSKDVDTREPVHDVKFARLSGGHLTPVTLQDGIAKILPSGAMSLFSSSYNFILKQLDDERTGKSNQKQRKEVKDVADTVASYIKSLSKDG